MVSIANALNNLGQLKGKPASASSLLAFFLHLSQKKTYVDKWISFLTGRMTFVSTN